jgi:predicted transcriptional regulator
MRKLKIPLEKRQAALDKIAKGKSPYEVARELKITPQAVYRWIDMVKKPRATVPSDLVQRIERIEKDIDFLKELLTKRGR